jgi:DNA-binding transcriptional regulator GbsR (MarR family)
MIRQIFILKNLKEDCMSLDKITKALQQNSKGLSITKIAELTGLSKSEISKTVAEMQSKGLIEKTVKGCRVTYKLKS